MSFVALPAQVAGQDLGAPEEGLRFRYARRQVKIPFKLVHNLVVIPIQINNSRPLNFVVDTGVDRTILVELGLLDSVSLHNRQKQFLRGLGRGQGLEATLSSGNTMRFAGVEAFDQSVLVLEENIFNLSSRLGMEINGIIGYPLFKNFVVEFDYLSKVMTLYKPGSYPARKARKSTVVPMAIEDAKPYVLAKVTFSDGQAFPLRLIVDSGMSAALLLYPTTLPGMEMPAPRIEAFLGRGLNGDIHGEIGRIANLELGGFTLPSLPASFPDSVSIRHALGLRNRNGNLGAEVLHRFNVVFDYSKGRMLLRPTYKLHKPFFYNLSGLELINPIPGFNFYTVAVVLPNSPAEQAGLLPGDAILSINGESCYKKSFGEVLQKFESNPGRTLLLKVSRNYQEFTTTLLLQDLI